ncbi:tryptophan synthase subunit alpha [Limisalsivibrio acetivorans]|uniref:tryptophan synthase subunit alpha n=1 Tax=Limisalsivibrio acetivorans TaxID=1304888 RepID=UPI0003B4843B|nr:tryptophan synthase subunit alpha [Limisalsivibrio acetivorans]
MRGIYIVGNYPDKETFIKCFNAVRDAGFDFVEIGVPFSEPVADGPVIAGAIQKALDSGITANDVLKTIADLEPGNMKVYVMTYSNIIYGYGAKAFSDDYKGLVSGLIIPDLPNRLHSWAKGQGLEIPVIPFVTPESRDEDLEHIKETDADFIYMIGIRGITGQGGGGDISGMVSDLRRFTDKPVVLGFGIKTPEDAKKAYKAAGGFVVGTAAVEKQEDPHGYAEYVKSLI